MSSRKNTGSGRDKKSCMASLKGLTVEPAGFLLVVALVVSHLAFQNVVMETICRVDLEYDADICKEIINKVNITYKAEEREIQKVVAGVQAITSVIFSCITVLVVLFIGPWSDANGRKVPLLLSMSGLILMPTMMIVGYLCLGKIAALPMAFLVMFPMTLTGGIVVFGMSAGSYICDTTTPKNRTVRMGVFSASVRSGTPIGFVVGGLLMKFQVGIIKSLLVSVCLLGLAFVLVLLRVKNGKPEGAEEDGDENGGALRNRRKISCWRKYNPVTKLIQAFAILFQKREHPWRFYLLILVHICYAAPGAEHAMIYLFVRERLQWNISSFGFFSMVNWLLSAAGVFLSMYVLSKKLKLSDALVGFVSGISQIGGSMLYAFSTTPAMMYCASALDMMNGTINVVVKSMLSKLVAANEVGKLFALLGVIDSLLPLVMMPTYAMVYRSTVTFFAGAFFLLSAGITIPAEIIFLYFMCSKDDKVEETNEEPTALDQLQSTMESLNRSVPDLAKFTTNDVRLSREGFEDDEESDVEESRDLKF